MSYERDVMNGTPWFLWWNWQPVILIALILLIGAYGSALWRHQRSCHEEQHSMKTSQPLLFVCGVGTLVLALLSPLEQIAHLLFTGHMVQHLTLALMSAPLLIVGTPPWLLADLLSARWMTMCWRWLTMPVLASLLFNGNLWIWHAPPLLEAMMHSTPLHVLALLLFLFTGLLFWWPVLAPELPGLPTHSLLEKLLYIFFSDMPMLLLGAGLTFTAPLYPSYRMEPRLWGMSAEIDQQLGGLLMWIPGSIFLIVIASGLFLRWMLAQEDELRQRER